MGRLRGSRHRLGLDRRGAQRIGRHRVLAAPDATPGALQLVTKNVQHAERLITQVQMQAAGLAQVEAARSDGRWATAYAGSATMVMPEDFLAALKKDPAAQAFYATLQTAEPVHHLPPAAQRQAPGDPGEAHGGVFREVGARGKPLIFAARARGRKR